MQLNVEGMRSICTHTVVNNRTIPVFIGTSGQDYVKPTVHERVMNKVSTNPNMDKNSEFPTDNEVNIFYDIS
jgi:hypothetical protein